MGRIKIEGYVCERCEHEWVRRGKEEPRVCPKCKSPYWNVPRKKKISKLNKINKTLKENRKKSKKRQKNDR